MNRIDTSVKNLAELDTVGDLTGSFELDFNKVGKMYVTLLFLIKVSKIMLNSLKD